MSNISLVLDNQALSIWILPLRLISDEEPAVRKRTMCIINRYVELLNVNFGINGLVVGDELSVPKLTTVPLKAQEYLLDCYILFFTKSGIFHLIVQMVGWCLAGYIKAVNCEHTTKQKEVGCFSDIKLTFNRCYGQKRVPPDFRHLTNVLKLSCCIF